MIAPQTSTCRVRPFAVYWTSARVPCTSRVTCWAFTSSRSDARAAPGTSIVAMARTIAAALTPLRDRGRELDDDAFMPYLGFLSNAGIEGVLLLGTTGEGILLSLSERKRAISNAVSGPLPVLAHCGAQTTADTVALAAAAAEAGAEGVAVIAPPYFQFDDDALLAHFVAAAQACAPLPFYVYELEKASGYAIPVSVVERLRSTVDNVAGMKVSDAPFAKVAALSARGPRRLHRRRGADRRRARRGSRRCGVGPRIGLPGGGRRGGANRRLDRCRRAARDRRPLPAPRGAQGGRPAPVAFRSARTCAGRCAA